MINDSVLFDESMTLENFDHQPNRQVFKLVVELIKELRAEKISAREALTVSGAVFNVSFGMVMPNNSRRVDAVIKKVKFKERLYDLTGVKVNLLLNTGILLNAFAIPPDLNKNIIASYDFFKYVMTNADHVKMMDEAEKAGKDAVGTIDVTNAKIGGVFSDHEYVIGMSHQIMILPVFSPEEAAAIFCHELGHIMTVLYYSTYFSRVNHVMQAFSTAYADAETSEVRVKLLGIAMDKLDINSIHPVDTAKVTNERIVVQLLVNEYAVNTKSTSGAKLLDSKTCEALADQFAIRMGAGHHLSSALFKMMTVMSPSTTIKILYPFALLKSLIMTIANLSVLPVHILIRYTLDLDNPYDPPKRRIDRMRNELVSSLKQMDRNDPSRKIVQEEIRKIDIMSKALIADLPMFGQLLEMIYHPLSIKRRVDARFFSKLEDMTNNNLFVSANKLYVKSLELE